MTTQYQKDKESAQNAAQYQANLVTYKNWLVNRPEIVDCVANQKAFESYMDWSDEFTEADLDFAVSNMEGQLATQRLVTPEEVKAALVAKIVQLTGAKAETTYKLAVSGGREVKWSVKLLPTFSIEQLTELLDEWLRKKTLEAKPHEEIQQIVESGRPTYGFPQLPKQIVRPGTVRAVPLDAAYLRGLDTYELKKNIRLYGLEQVNARIRGEEN
jgi:hypothetical protein